MKPIQKIIIYIYVCIPTQQGTRNWLVCPQLQTESKSRKMAVIYRQETARGLIEQNPGGQVSMVLINAKLEMKYKEAPSQ